MSQGGFLFFKELKIMAYSEYKVELIQDGGCSTLLFGSGNLPVDKVQNVINQYAQNGWTMVFQVIESRRFLLFWTRQAILITFAR